MTDHLDAIMAVMETAFDPAFGEAWSRRQVGDALLLPNTFCLLAGADGEEPEDQGPITGFALSRFVVDQEELLLLAIHPDWRRRGIARRLLARFIAASHDRGAVRLFLEMREGNCAQIVYRSAGFKEIGRRKHYYRRGSHGPLDAITFGLDRPAVASSNN